METGEYTALMQSENKGKASESNGPIYVHYYDTYGTTMAINFRILTLVCVPIFFFPVFLAGKLLGATWH